jgi:glucosylceramidase
VRRGARVIASHGQVSEVEHVAFLNPDGSRVLVLGNQGSARRLSVRAAGKSLDIDLPADSAFTVVWD